MRLLFIACLLSLLLPLSMTAQSSKVQTLEARVGKVMAVPDPDARAAFLEMNAMWDAISAGTLDEDTLGPRGKRLLNASDSLFAVNVLNGMNCSWYCGVKPNEINATSGGAPMTSVTDHDGWTSWFSDVSRQPASQSFTIELSGELTAISRISLLNGYLCPQGEWDHYGRADTLLIRIDGHTAYRFHLQDTRALQTITLPQMLEVQKSGPIEIEFEIVSVYPGNGSDACAITEVIFDGPHHH